MPDYLALGPEILKYIPQRPPMVMIDKLLVSDDEKTTTGLTVSDSNIFVENGALMPPGLIENMAQTAAVRAGYLYVTKGEPVPLGFIGGLKKVKIYETPPVGAELITEVRVFSTVMNITAIKSEIQYEGNIIAESEMKIFVQN